MARLIVNDEPLIPFDSAEHAVMEIRLPRAYYPPAGIQARTTPPAMA